MILLSSYLRVCDQQQWTGLRVDGRSVGSMVALDLQRGGGCRERAVEVERRKEGDSNMGVLHPRIW